MSNKFEGKVLLALCVCLLVLGCIFKFVIAESQKGSRVTTGVMINGEYREINSGVMGGNQEKSEKNNLYGNIFLVLSGVTGIGGIVLIVRDRKTDESSEVEML